MHTSHRWAAAIAVLALIFTSLTSAYVANAEEPSDAGPSTAQQPAVVIGDFSGSMKEPDADQNGTTREDAAKTAIKGLLEQAPEGSQLGLVVFGANNWECTDIQTVHPVGEFDAAELSKQIDELNAFGNTPIGPALEHAAAELKDVEGPSSIVLVSDGEPNCEPPPACDVAKDLADQGIDLTVHTIGFKVRDNKVARETLECIADVTGGEYHDVENGEELAEQLRQKTFRDSEGYLGEGIPVEGGATLEEAEGIVAGQYVMPLPSGEDLGRQDYEGEHPNRRYFSIPRQEGWNIEISAVLVPPTEASGAQREETRALEIITINDFGRMCGFEENSDIGTVSDLKVHVTTKADDSCGEDELYLAVTRMGEGWPEALDVELAVSYISGDGAGTPVDPGPAPAIKESEPTEVAGGSSFNNATLLEPGQTISDNINGSERRYFAIPIEDGQNVRPVIHALPMEGANTVGLSIYNPARMQMNWAPGDDITGNGSVLDVGQESEATLDPAINAAYYYQSDDSQSNSIGGIHYLVLGREWNEESGLEAMPYTLTVDVWGEPTGNGLALINSPEDYQEEFGETTPTPSTSTSVSVSASAQEDTVENANASEDNDSSAWLLPVGIIVGLVVLIALVVAIIAVVRSKRGIGRI